MDKATAFINRNMTATGPGFGVLNIRPLPAFPTGLERLHLLRREIGISQYNRVTLDQEVFADDGAQYQPLQIYSENTLQRFRANHALNYSSGFTFALAVDVREAVAGNFLIHSDDSLGQSENPGFRMRTEATGSADLRLGFRLQTLAGRTEALVSFNHPPAPAFMLVFGSYDGTNVTLDIPHASQRVTGTLATGSPSNVAPNPDAGVVFASRQFPNAGREELLTKMGFAAYAYWPLALSAQEVTDAHAGLVEWAKEYGLVFV